MVFIGNSLSSKSLTHLESYVEGKKLTKFALNLYANSVGVEGGEILGKSLKNVNDHGKLKSLSVDLYFSNITEVGTKAVTDSVVEMKSLESLNLNFDFNYIKNEGGKYIGDMFKKMQKLKEITIGVGSKNFGYLGFKSLIDGLKTQN